MNLMREADVLAASGEYAEAAQSYLRLVGHGDPDIHTAALLGLADARYRLDDEAGAQATWQAATQAPENSFSWLAWKQTAAALVRAGNLRPAIDAYREAERRAPADQRAEISSRLGWLYKETGDAGRARGYFSRARGSVFTPWVTYLVIAVTVGIGLAQIALNFPADVFTQMLALDKTAVAQGELWRLLTVVLVHEGIIHLGFNMYALLIVGPLVERIFGHGLWVVMYLVTAAAASVLSYILLPNEDAVGASGAIFGLFGILGTTLWFYRPMVAQRARPGAADHRPGDHQPRARRGPRRGRRGDRHLRPHRRPAGRHLAWPGRRAAWRADPGRRLPEARRGGHAQPRSAADPPVGSGHRPRGRHRRGPGPGHRSAGGLTRMSRSLAACFAGTFTLRFSTGLTGALLGFYLAHLADLGGTNIDAFVVGLMSAGFYLSELVLATPFGIVSDRVGHHRVMQAGPVFGFAAAVLTGLSRFITTAGATLLVPVLTVTRALEGTSTAASVPSILGYVAAATAGNEELRGRSAALFETATLGGLGAGFIVAPKLFEWVGTTAFFLNAVVYVVSLLIFRVGVSDPRADAVHAAPQEGGWRRYGKLLGNAEVLLLAPTWVAVNAAIGLWFSQSIFQFARRNTGSPTSSSTAASTRARSRSRRSSSWLSSGPACSTGVVGSRTCGAARSSSTASSAAPSWSPAASSSTTARTCRWSCRSPSPASLRRASSSLPGPPRPRWVCWPTSPAASPTIVARSWASTASSWPWARSWAAWWVAWPPRCAASTACWWPPSSCWPSPSCRSSGCAGWSTSWEPAMPETRTGTPTFGNFIDGTWRPSHSGRTFASHDPSDDRHVIGHFAASDAADVAEAVRAAESAFPAWRRTPAPRRGELLYGFAALLAQHKERLARALTAEMGKVLPEARGDVQEAIDIAYLMAGEGRRLFGDTVPSELPDKWAMSVREPIGVAGLITPWNFPIAIPAWKMMPALVAGNTVVWKPASDTPHCAVLFVELLAEAGLPAGVVNLVTGSGADAGEPLVASPDVPVLSFTGHGDNGRRIAVLAAHRLKRLSLELGGKNGIIVLADADLDLAVDGIVWSAFGTTGQRCTACSRVIVQEAVADALVDRLAERAAALRLGPGLDPQTDVGPLINRPAVDKVGG